MQGAARQRDEDGGVDRQRRVRPRIELQTTPPPPRRQEEARGGVSEDEGAVGDSLLADEEAAAFMFDEMVVSGAAASSVAPAPVPDTAMPPQPQEAPGGRTDWRLGGRGLSSPRGSGPPHRPLR